MKEKIIISDKILIIGKTTPKENRLHSLVKFLISVDDDFLT